MKRRDPYAPYTLVPGEQAEIRIPLRYLGKGNSVRVSVPRSSASTGRRPVALTVLLDKTPAPPSRPSAAVEQNWWLPQHDAEAPPDLLWDEYGR